MTSPILFKGNEDLDWTVVGGSMGYSSTTGGVYWQTSSRFRSRYVRGAVIVNGNSSSQQNSYFIRGSFAASSNFWFSARMATFFSGQTLSNSTPPRVISFEDAGGQRRLQIRMTGTNMSAGASWVMESVNNSNVATQLGSAFTYGLPDGSTIPHKIDIHVTYGTSGAIVVWFNGVQVYSFSGDTTTNSATQLASVTLGSASIPSTSSANANTTWSEVLISTRDTRRMALMARPAMTRGSGTQDWQTTAYAAATQSNSNGAANSTHSNVAGTHTINLQNPSGLPLNLTGYTYVSSSGGGSGDFQGGLYRDANIGGQISSPNELLGSTGTVNSPGSSTFNLNFSTPIPINNGSAYHQAIYCPSAITIQAVFSLNTNWAARGVSLNNPINGVQRESTGNTQPARHQGNYAASPINPSPSSAVQHFFDNASAANQVDFYIPGCDRPPGAYGFAEISVRGYAKRGNGQGPQHLQFGFRISGTDYFSGSDVSPGLTPTLLDTAFDVNPATSAAWLAADLPINSDGTFQVGVKATA